MSEPKDVVERLRKRSEKHVGLGHSDVLKLLTEITRLRESRLTLGRRALDMEKTAAFHEDRADRLREALAKVNGSGTIERARTIATETLNGGG